MKLWITIIISFLVQEIVTTNSVLLRAYQQNYNLWIISLLFLVATAFIISGGFSIGKWIQNRFSQSKVVVYSERKVGEFERALGPQGSRLSLLLLGIVNFNYVNAFLASWLSLSFKEVFFFLMLGDLIWFASNGLLILGIDTLISPAYATYVLLGFSVLVTVMLGLVHKKVMSTPAPITT